MKISSKYSKSGIIKQIKSLSFVLMTFGLFACNDLDLVPVSQLTGSNFPLTDNDAIAAINGIYTANSNFSSSSSYVTELPADATQCGEEVTSGSGASIGVFQHDESNPTVETVWTVLYNGITNANAAIDNIAVSSVSEPLKTRLINEAKFLRALYYFYLVQLWGEVPLVLHPEQGVGATRAPLNDVYQQIVTDLTDATELPASFSGADYGRATKGAAYALLAKVNLVWAQVGDSEPKAKYAAAVAAADNVTGYVLEEEFLDNWNTSKRNSGKEKIFTANHVNGQYPEGGRNHLAHCSFASGFSQVTPHLIISDISFYNRFDDQDQRKKGSYAKQLVQPDGQVFTFLTPRFRKYIDTINISTTNLTLDIDRTILRYADVLLIKAEALNELNDGPTSEAYAAINQVRRRAYRQSLNQLSAYDLSGLNHHTFQDAVREERFKEFVYEQQRYFDLVRWRILVKSVKDIKTDVLAEVFDSDGNQLFEDDDSPKVQVRTTMSKSNVALKHYRFAIPKSQRDINPEGLWQNWGWDGADPAKTGTNPYAGFE
ncbi:MAG: RagB/SusD family nutrient uptake outer membrane protein [Candidatus Ordinivivax streblomastigis]|uniref:RagB/SusD family nutrient uptake outer membrane protein n=1 Tax=Candidatus Ordinivivax streblomastigis TaxID=2540710 RepID=A0A5M8NU19_9BACT|nr:MAG: RagB/SusD family nutrient uptake outer membrane protein [Candidatus Ordinivivax streblomastigis]